MKLLKYVLIFSLFITFPAISSFSDKDNDGIKNRDDQCPRQAEDIDNFHDNDGCPDPDNDNDGILDINDKCPNEAEDIDNYKDIDGCPDPDNDNDGIMDVNDRCPDLKEDFDGYQDSDGCPDVDNDRDGIRDSLDKCINNAEDKDGFEDSDGCPDVDNDKDGILDINDKCPNKKETINGVMDSDGCPDEDIPQIPLGKTIFKGITFQGRTATINYQSYPTLDTIAKSMEIYSSTEIEIIANVDKSSDPDADYELSMNMAGAVRDYLIQKSIAEERITITGLGSSRPIASNVTPEGRRENCRIEINRTK